MIQSSRHCNCFLIILKLPTSVSICVLYSHEASGHWQFKIWFISFKVGCIYVSELWCHTFVHRQNNWGTICMQNHCQEEACEQGGYRGCEKRCANHAPPLRPT